MSKRVTVGLRALDRAGLVLCLATGLLLALAYLATGDGGTDARTYWVSGHGPMYGVEWTAETAYVYPPPLAQLTSPFPWQVFLPVWLPLTFAAFWYVARWLALPLLLAAWLGLAIAGPSYVSTVFALMAVGNAQMILIACSLLAIRHPAMWAVAILLKIAPGIGLVWHAARAEWRAVGIALAATAALALASFVLAPGAWADFVRFAAANKDHANYMPTIDIALWFRAVTGAVLLVWGGRTSREWTVPVAVGWTAITMYEAVLATALVAAACVALRRAVDAEAAGHLVRDLHHAEVVGVQPVHG